jgi:RimJ/RimL family protein N-acetyltransferase
MQPLPTLTDGTIVLRPWVDDDADDLFREIQDPEVVRWLNVDMPYTLEDAVGFIAEVVERWEKRAGAHFVIADAGDGRFLGYLGVLDAGQSMNVVEIVYWVAAAGRRRGVARRAVALALEWVLLELAPERIELAMIDGNEASIRVAEANGFQLREIVSGGATLDGRPADTRIYDFPLPN